MRLAQGTLTGNYRNAFYVEQKSRKIVPLGRHDLVSLRSYRFPMSAAGFRAAIFCELPPPERVGGGKADLPTSSRFRRGTDLLAAIFCELPPPERVGGGKADLPTSSRFRRGTDLLSAGGKIILQPRLCTLRSYGSGAIRPSMRVSGNERSRFFSFLVDYVESARKSHDMEIISGRLSMIAFSVAMATEFVTGNSLFKKLNFEEIAGAVGLCLAVVASAASFAWFSSAKARIGQMLTLSCNSFVDSLVDNIVDGLFYEGDPMDWYDEMNN
ncbi:hypothetical protein HPP92_013077 [Vanilla planifolia]|uniref:Stress enhanced protein 2 n=1 Tax=Vanilla planifolia TaxID=51239 RepID=A0A835QSB6_VANPL|nr:hypothetical protein HPP92_013077 [Vanilla planifolia]